MSKCTRSTRDTVRLSGRPLTLAEKILSAHLSPNSVEARPKKSCTPICTPIGSRCRTRPRRWPSSSSCTPEWRPQSSYDRALRPPHSRRTRIQNDLLTAIDENKIYEFLPQSVSAKYGIGFWKAAGIIHQVVLGTMPSRAE